jgi:predicted GIY-YIG superfamily endonuclease
MITSSREDAFHQKPATRRHSPQVQINQLVYHDIESAIAREKQLKGWSQARIPELRRRPKVDGYRS